MGAPYAAPEHQVSYLRAIFGLLGITRVTVVQAEEVRTGPKKAEAGMAMAGAMEQVAPLKAA